LKHSVSVIVPLHNKGTWIEETLLSLRQQDFESWEAIVVENNSEDDGPKIAKEYAKLDARIRFVDASGNITGPGAARNLGLRHAKNSWVSFLDADDLICQNHYSSLLETAEASRCDVISSDWIEFRNDEWDWDKSPLNTDSVPKNSTLHLATGSNPKLRHIAVEDSSIAFAPWAVHCGLVSRQLFQDSIKWVEKLDNLPSEDTAFWFRVVTQHEVAYTHLATALYRTETTNCRNKFEELPSWAEALEQIHEENIKFLKQIGSALNQSHFESLMRVWEKLAKDAYEKSLMELGSHSLGIASDWLKHCKVDIRRPDILARKLFGLGNILSLQNYYRKCRPTL